MHALSDRDILRVWEAAASQHQVDRALTILAAAYPRHSRRQLAELPVGRRDARLLEVYEATFGAQLAGLGLCPGCGTRVEFALDTRDLSGARAQALPPPPAASDEGYEVLFRPPDSFDMAAIAGLTDVREARGVLIERCLVKAAQHGAPLPVEQIPDPVIDLAIARMAGMDPQAEIELQLACPSCGHSWPLLLDIASFLWTRIEAHAGRLLREVHALASAYGWREADILRMSPARRGAYGALVR